MIKIGTNNNHLRNLKRGKSLTVECCIFTLKALLYIYVSIMHEFLSYLSKGYHL